MSEQPDKPHPQSAVLGGNHPPPVTAAVLGGTDALKRQQKRLLVSKKGDSIETPLTDAHALQVCRSLKHNSFAQNLWEKSQQYPLSESQLVWVHKLAIEHLEETAPELRQSLAPQALTQIVQFISQASAHLKQPTMRLIDPEQGEIRLARAHPNSKHPERIYVRGIDYDQRYGHIVPAGSLLGDAVFRRERDCPDWVIRLLERFSQNPVGLAQAYGKLTGRCCFCMGRLTDERSVASGYGKICAQNYGLPWGEVPTADNDDIPF